ncbi:MAG TPA: hemolysin family protein [Capillimicrobium sp.]
MIDVLLILIALALVGACGAFVAAEFSLITVDRATVEREAEGGDRAARGVLAALRSLSTQLSGAQLGITVTNLLIGYMAEPAIAGLIDAPLESAGVPSGAVTGVSVTIALLLATGVTMVFGELVPKNLAIAAPLATARAVQRFQRGFTAATGVAIRSFNGSANAILRRLGIEPQEELASARSPGELASLVRRSEEEGTLARDTAVLVQRSLAFGERHASDVMTPRGLMSALAPGDPVLRVFEQARETGRSRFPVVEEEGPDEVVGIVHIKDAVAVEHARRADVPVREVMSEPVLVPSSLDLDTLMARLREGGLQMAVVVDEWGNVDGVVTLEDLVEEIVGDLRDEHDPRDPAARREADGSWSLSGLMRPDEVLDAVGVVLPEDEAYETLGGLMGSELGRVPEEADAVEVDAIDTERRPLRVALAVLAMDGLRVDRVRLTATEVEPDADDREGEAG